MQITRREIAAALLGTPSALTQSAEADPLEQARAEVRKAIESMEKVELEMSTEPAFVFKP